MANLQKCVQEALEADDVRVVEKIQALWSNYGSIERVRVRKGSETRTLIAKVIAPPADDGAGSHPRSWASSRSHARKVRSYKVERNFYAGVAALRLPADGGARVPQLVAQRCDEASGRSLLLLEDLDACGFAERHQGDSVSDAQVAMCLDWLARFHGQFVNADVEKTCDLWPIGTYWHLETRPDELEKLSADEPLRQHAAELDRRLRDAAHQTLVHGDAKLANFCFGKDAVAAVDFQYVGRGVGIRDVVYLLGCLSERRLARRADKFFDQYFAKLRRAIDSSVDGDALEREWRSLISTCFADFERFLRGWAPEHYKLSGYSAAQTQLAMDQIDRDRSQK